MPAGWLAPCAIPQTPQWRVTRPGTLVVSRNITSTRTLTMALFDVPGWSVPDDPVAVTPQKRKRTSKSDSNKIRSATVNVERVMEQLAARPGPAAVSPQKEDNNRGLSTGGGRPSKKKRRHVEGNKSQQAPTPTAIQQVETHRTPKKKRKKGGPKETSGDKTAGSQSPSSRLASEAHSTLTSLQHDMKQSLDGARFRCVIYPYPNSYAGDTHLCTLKSRRWVNEKLYKSDSAHAHAMMREDPAVFNDVRLSMPLLASIHSHKSAVSQGFPTSSRILAI